jgi:DNA-binding GntR family transcriptional regulator/DNA-binding LacI/PurR family transcriptional regulator
MQKVPPAKRPALETAVRFMRRLLAAGRLAPGHRLPTSRALAAQAGVSPNTMLSALRILSAEGLVSLRRSRGILVGPDEASNQPATETPAAVRKTRAHRLTAQLRREIMSGSLAHVVRLPPTKQLCSRYGVCATTLRRALHTLQGEDLLHEYRRGYRIHPPLHRNANAVGLVVGSDATGLWTQHSSVSWQTEFTRALESECLRRGLDLITFSSQAEPLSPAAPAHARPELLGLISSRLSTAVERLINATRHIGGREMPAAFFDLDIAGWPKQRMPLASFGVFTPSQRDAGKRVGRYLWQLGHTDVCYVCPYHENRWSHERLEGLRQAFSEAGARPDAVVPITRDGVTVHLNYGEGNQPFGIGLIQHCTHINRRFGLRPDAYIALRGTAADIEESVRLREATGPLVERALETKATAWVAGNDRAAFAILSLLRDRGIEVPGRVSLIGFDDSVVAFHNNLSSYSFDIATCALRALNFVTYRQPRSRSNQVVETIPGMVVPRSTTAACRV